MRVPDAHDIRFDALNAALPPNRIGRSIFIEWIARRRMHKHERPPIDGQVMRRRQAGEVVAVVLGNPLPGHGPRRAGEILEAGSAVGDDVLRNRVIVIAADAKGISPHPANHRRRLATVVDQIA